MNNNFAKLDKLLNKFVDKKTNPGCACSIMQGDKIIYEGCAGYADIESGKLITPDSIFRQEDMTRLFTSVVLGMLFEEGEFLYSDPVGDYLPEWKNPKKYVVSPNGTVDVAPLKRKLTIRHALTMMCGLPDIEIPIPNGKTPTLIGMQAQLEKLLEKGVTPTLRDEVRAMAEVPVMFEPYSHWEYGYGSELASAVVEEITGQPLREVFMERIIKPLGLENTDTYITDANRDKVVTAYRKNEDGTFTADPSADKAYDPAQTPVLARPMILSTAGDIAAFMQMLANNGTYKGQKFLGSGTVEMFRNNQLEEPHYPDFVNDINEGYAFGMGFRTVVRMKYGFNGHFDNFGGYGRLGTFTECDTEGKFSIAYMQNVTPMEQVYHHNRVRAVAYGYML